MFKALPLGSTLGADRRLVSRLLRSSNASKVAFGAGPMRMARASIVAMNLPGGVVQVYVWLGLIEKGSMGEVQGLLFRSDPASVPASAVETVVQQAIALVGQQGFDMRAEEIGAVSDDRRALLLADLPFEADLPFAADRGPTPSASGRAARDDVDFGTGAHARPVEISQAISLPGRETVQVLGRLLSLF